MIDDNEPFDEEEFTFDNDTHDEPIEEDSPFTEEEEKEEEELPPEEDNEEEPAKEELFNPNDVPLTLNVELAKLKMNLQKLLQLTPGNVLDLTVTPEQGIDLTLSGKCVARGVLVHVGETLGVKITEIP